MWWTLRSLRSLTYFKAALPYIKLSILFNTTLSLNITYIIIFWNMTYILLTFLNHWQEPVSHPSCSRKLLNSEVFLWQQDQYFILKIHKIQDMLKLLRSHWPVILPNNWPLTWRHFKKKRHEICQNGLKVVSLSPST